MEQGGAATRAHSEQAQDLDATDATTLLNACFWIRKVLHLPTNTSEVPGSITRLQKTSKKRKEKK